MAFEIQYFHDRVLAEIESWPVDVLADYARLVELLAEYGPSLRLPHSRAFGDGLFELRPRGRAGIGRLLLLHDGQTSHGAARVHQEDPTNARPRTEAGAHAPQGVARWLS